MLPPPFRWQDEHLRVELPGASVLFTTRRGGVSAGPYAGLNLGRWTDDDPVAVERNRAEVQAAAGVRFAYGRQVHGAEVVLATGATDGDPANADGQVSRAPGVAPMVLTADCLPVAIAGGGTVAMLHAGWRGLAAGVIERGVAAVREQAGPESELHAAIGPGAGVCCYEVSDDVRAAFAADGRAVRRGSNLDLKAIAANALARAGVSTVHDCGLCTICSDPALFFSHRRDGGVTGRQAGVVWLA